MYVRNMLCVARPGLCKKPIQYCTGIGTERGDQRTREDRDRSEGLKNTHTPLACAMH